MTQVSLMLFNVQDMFIFMDKYNGQDLNSINEYDWQLMTTSLSGNKELSKLFEIKQAIEDVSPDILMLIEVGGKESVANFNQYFLNNTYNVFHEPSNSDRGIDVAYLIKKDLPFYADLKAYTKIYLSNNKKPARGFFKLKLTHNNKTKLAIILTHLKSKLDLKKEDFEGREQRKAEVEFLTKQIKQHNDRYPLLIAGDLNGIIYGEDTDEELKDFKKLHMLDVLELIDKDINERYTFVYFNKSQQRFPMQLDYILMKEKFRQFIIPEKTYVYHFKTPNGNDMGLPDNRVQKSYFPSDHYPLVLNLSFSEK